MSNTASISTHLCFRISLVPFTATDTQRAYRCPPLSPRIRPLTPAFAVAIGGVRDVPPVYS